MDKVLLVVGSVIFVMWFTNFDSEAYLREKTADKMEIQAGNEVNLKNSKRKKESYIFPIKAKSLKDIISGYGDPRDQGKRSHQGIDIPDKKGTPVIAVADGRIKRISNSGNGGKKVWLESDTKSFLYAHLDSWNVKEGQNVKQGAVLGAVGSTGNARTPHLHFEVRDQTGKPMNPVKLFE